MSQQINLFNPIFLKQKKYFSAVTMAQGLGMIMLGCAALVAYSEAQLSKRTKDAAVTAAQLLNTRSQLITVSTQFAPHQGDPALDMEIKSMEASIDSAKQVFDTLRGGEFGDTKGYSSYFRSFARQIVDGLWLTEITIEGAGHDINLKGRAFNAELVPAYLIRLKHESDMAGKSFAGLNMQAQKDDAPSTTADGKPMKAKPAYIEFNLQSSEDTGAVATGVPAK